MLFPLVPVQASWHLDEMNAWRHVNGGGLALADVSDLPIERCTARVRRFRRLHRDSRIWIGSGSRVCVRTTEGREVVCGYLGKDWILAEFPIRTWRASLASFPKPTLTQFVRGLYPIADAGMPFSSFPLRSGGELRLPENYAWVDEKVGIGPTESPDYLICRDWKSPVCVDQFLLTEAKKARAVLRYAGFTPALLATGSETSRLGRTVAVSVRLPKQWIVLSGTPSDVRSSALKKLVRLFGGKRK